MDGTLRRLMALFCMQRITPVGSSADVFERGRLDAGDGLSGPRVRASLERSRSSRSWR
jgi:hypothetical protein